MIASLAGYIPREKKKNVVALCLVGQPESVKYKRKTVFSESSERKKK